MTRYMAEWIENRTTWGTSVVAESMEQAAQIIKESHPKATYISIGFEVTDTRKMYEVAIERKTEDGEDDFTQWLATYLTGPVEVPNTDETIGRFTHENMGKHDDLVHALFIEDEEGWVSEYYVFATPDTLKHVHIDDMAR